MKLVKVKYFDDHNMELVEEYFRAPSDMSDERALQMLTDALFPWVPEIIY